MYVHKPKDTDKHEHFSKHLIYILTVTFSLTDSFDVLVEATIDAASPCILLNLQSSPFAATHPFASQLLSAAVVE
ncbi:hypothetical protein B296_00024715 [Ensete ventricosum]|uniref:Uncharacterized protein n=1 Tax=Ensete ventricosum TaxID=4639 RepID=A0A426ZEI5_ENSVE|nr:hypothetical protein B296_00024715 [Ensete ventricosum]